MDTILIGRIVVNSAPIPCKLFALHGPSSHVLQLRTKKIKRICELSHFYTYLGYICCWPDESPNFAHPFINCAELDTTKVIFGGRRNYYSLIENNYLQTIQLRIRLQTYSNVVCL